MKRLSRTHFLTGFAVTLTLLNADLAPAKKPTNSSGGARFDTLELPIDQGRPIVISEAGPDDRITVAIEGRDGKSFAAYASIDRNSKQIVSAVALPEPPHFDPTNGQPLNGWSSPSDVNCYGDIVGIAQATLSVDDELTSLSRPIVWSNDGSGYSYVLLPTLAGLPQGNVYGINNDGDMVGVLHNDVDQYAAVLWDAETMSVVNLEAPYVADAGWDLETASDINDSGLIVGIGSRNGTPRGYLLDRENEMIWAVPLGGPATTNFAARINESGRVVGHMYDGEGNYWSPDGYDYVRGYSWDGWTLTPDILSPVTEITSHAFNLNDSNATVGASYQPTDSLFSYDSVPTLWEFDDEGNVTATDLTTAIPKNQRYWDMDGASDINNDGWITLTATKFERGRYDTVAVVLIPVAQ